MKRLSVVQKK